MSHDFRHWTQIISDIYSDSDTHTQQSIIIIIIGIFLTAGQREQE